MCILDSKTRCEVALTHLKNKQFITAHNLFLNQANSMKKTEYLKSVLLYMLAAECKSRQGKESKDEIEQAGNLFLQYSKTKNSKNIQGALLCASKCFLNLGEYDKAKISYQKAKSMSSATIEISRPIIIIDDSKAITMKLKNYVEKLGYSDIFVYENGKDRLKGSQKLFSDNKHPIIFLDMGLPDFDGFNFINTIWYLLIPETSVSTALYPLMIPLFSNLSILFLMVLSDTS